MSCFEFHTRVSYGDIDNNLNLTLQGAMRMMQEAAIIDSDRSGYSVRDIEHTHLGWMLVQWHVQMVEPAKWHENLVVTTWPRTMEKATSDRSFRITDSKGRTVALADSSWLLVNTDTKKLVRIPPEVAEAYSLTLEKVLQEAPKLNTGVGQRIYTAEVLRRDLDTNCHVNNLVYLDYARQALPAEEMEREFFGVVVRYHRQLLLGDSFTCYYEKTPYGHQVQICGDDPRLIHATVLFTD